LELNRDEVLHIARLARLGLTDVEVNTLSQQLSKLLKSFKILQQVDTTDVPPTAQPNTLNNVLKDDKNQPSLLPEDVLDNAPCKEKVFFRVRAVLE
jgi:aspartyl-tRNA(Asn)/glutamyl-tRNA(Gln) amidotransferase subunit C